MRKPRDIDAELKALAERAKDLKARKVVQLGELVMATGAEALDADILAGALLATTDADAEQKQAWRARGANFFREKARPARAARPGRTRSAASLGGAAPG